MVSNKVMPVRVGVFLALIAVGGCAAVPQPEPLSTSIDDPEAYVIYQHALSALQWPVTFVRRETTIGSPRGKENVVCDPYLSPDHDESWQSVLDDYVRQNSIKRTLRPLFAFKLIASEAIENAFRYSPYDWTRFFNEIDRNGYAEVSAVGFDQARTRAIVYSARHCGGTCGKGMHTGWQKRDGRWESAPVLSRSCEWRS
jgi:hypothetical protein